jgi:hypothetical protein
MESIIHNFLIKVHIAVCNAEKYQKNGYILM